MSTNINKGLAHVQGSIQPSLAVQCVLPEFLQVIHHLLNGSKHYDLMSYGELVPKILCAEQ